MLLVINKKQNLRNVGQIGTLHFKGRGAFPLSRQDSHRSFEQFRIDYVDFRPFPTHFAPITMFLIGNRPEINRKSRCGTTFHVLRVPDETTTPGGGPLLVSWGCQMYRPPRVGDRFWCPSGAGQVKLHGVMVRGGGHGGVGGPLPPLSGRAWGIQGLMIKTT